MRRLAAATAVLGGLLLTVPALPASACSYALPMLGVSTTRVPQGATLRVSGDDFNPMPPCEMTPPVAPTSTPEPTETAEPTEEPSETAEPTESATPEPTTTTPAPTATTTTPAPVAVAPAAVAAPAVVSAPKPADRVVIGIGRPGDERIDVVAGPVRTLAYASARSEPTEWGGVRYVLDTTVKIPADLAPGTYRLTAGQQGVAHFGTADITVVAALPDTGRDIAPLATLAAALLLAGVGALALEQGRAARRTTD
jgi:hypothetical protein